MLQHLGEDGYLERVRVVQATTAKLLAGIGAVRGLRVLGRPDAGVFAFTSDELDMYQLGDAMEARGWKLDRQMAPPALHCMVTPGHAQVADAFLADLTGCVAALGAGQPAPEGSVAMYGMVGAAVERAQVDVIHPGVGHTDGDLVVLLEGRRVLVTGDLFLAGYEPFIDVEAGGDPLALRAALGLVLALDFETVLPGHGDPVTRREVEHLRDYLGAVEAAVRAAQGRGLSEDAAVTEVRLPETGLKSIPFGSSRENTVRLVYRALAQTR